METATNNNKVSNSDQQQQEGHAAGSETGTNSASGQPSFSCVHLKWKQRGGMKERGTRPRHDWCDMTGATWWQPGVEGWNEERQDGDMVAIGCMTAARNHNHVIMNRTEDLHGGQELELGQHPVLPSGCVHVCWCVCVCMRVLVCGPTLTRVDTLR